MSRGNGTMTEPLNGVEHRDTARRILQDGSLNTNGRGQPVAMSGESEMKKGDEYSFRHKKWA